MEHITGDGKFILPKNEGILFEHDCFNDILTLAYCNVYLRLAVKIAVCIWIDIKSSKFQELVTKLISLK